MLMTKRKRDNGGGEPQLKTSMGKDFWGLRKREGTLGCFSVSSNSCFMFCISSWLKYMPFGGGGEMGRGIFDMQMQTVTLTLYFAFLQ